jgi:hypothetical protein
MGMKVKRNACRDLAEEAEGKSHWEDLNELERIVIKLMFA